MRRLSGPYLCPNDSTLLKISHRFVGQRWICTECSGNLIFRRNIELRKGAAEFFKAFDTTATVSERSCPVCSEKFYDFISNRSPRIVVDGCKNCGAFWFDTDELEQTSTLQQKQELTSAENEALARSILEAMKERDEKWFLDRKYDWLRYALIVYGIFLIYMTISHQADHLRYGPYQRRLHGNLIFILAITIWGVHSRLMPWIFISGILYAVVSIALLR